MKNGKISTLILFVFTALVVAATAWICLNYNLALDIVANLNYTPSAEFVALEQELQLTDDGIRIFRASRPELNDKAAFNTACVSYNPGVSVMGCYKDGIIHVFNVNSDELADIKESTFAHELLHAVWARLSDGEHAELEASLEEVYKANAEDLAVVEKYPADSRFDELFARAGTQVKDLPEKLESVYARYFKDQDQIVEFYDNYSAPFKELAQKAEAISAEIEDLKQIIEEETADYQKRSSALSKQVSQFNACADSGGCFDSDAEFYAKRESLLAEKTALNALYNKINADVATYNEKVAEYNENLLYTNYLNDTLNSNLE